MLKTTVSVLALSATLGLAPATFAQDTQTTTQTQQQPTAGEQSTTTTTEQPAAGAATTTTTTEGTTTTTQPAQTETTTTEQTTTTTEPAAGQQMKVETVPAEGTTTQPVEDQQMEVQTQPAEGQPVPGQMFQQSANQFLGSTLMDATVQSKDGERIGEVNDLVINSNGTIEGVVVGVGGFLGIGEKDVAVRLNQITIQQDPNNVNDLTFVLNATREELEAAPRFQTQREQQAEQATQGATMEAGTGAATTTTMQPAAPATTTEPAAGGTTTTTTTTEQPAEGQSQ